MKSELEKIKKKDKELNFRAARTEDYLSQIAELKKADEIMEKLTKLSIPRLKENHIKKIIDLNPRSVNELKVILHGYTVNVSNDSMKKIVDLLSKY